MATELIVSLDSKGRIVIPKEKRKAKHYRLIDRGRMIELVPLRSFDELKGKYPLRGSLSAIEERVEERIVRKERKIWAK